jgi:hypothetical protein
VFDVAWMIMVFEVLFNRNNRCKCFQIDWGFPWLAIPIENLELSIPIRISFHNNADLLKFSSFVTN